MKKYIFPLMVGGLILSSCSKDKKPSYDDQIQEAIAGFKFPVELPDNSSMTGCKYEDKTITFEVEVSKDAISKMDGEKKRSETLDKLGTDIMPRKLVKSLSAADVSVRYIYYNDKDTVAFTFKPEELKAE